MNGSGERIEICDGSPRRIPSPGVVAVAAVVVVGVAATAAIVAAGGGGLLDEGGECWEVAAP